MKKIIFTALIMLSIITAAEAGNLVPYVFDLPTAQTNGSGIFNLDIGHRYFDVNRHTTNINIALSYGIFDPLDVLLAYSFRNKDIIGSLKLNVLNDFSETDILSLSVYGGTGYKDTNEVNNWFSLSAADSENIEAVTTLQDSDRFSFFTQVIIQKHMFSNRFSIGLVPSFAYNTNFYQVDSKEDWSAGTGIFTEIYFTDHAAFCGELVMNLGGFAFKYMTYNAGFKYAGYRHTFSLWLSNSNGYSPVEYMTGNEVLTPKFCAAFTREFD
ncbi:MAG TPA: DUF5777 family beta-barrel protein [Spirochaetota bacterium]|nr:DUF5777 family beta-barrel protein [Spirochaetota bacterium]